jgi:hypothetical protein
MGIGSMVGQTLHQNEECPGGRSDAFVHPNTHRNLLSFKARPDFLWVDTVTWYLRRIRESYSILGMAG